MSTIDNSTAVAMPHTIDTKSMGMRVLFLKDTYRETKKGRAYLKACCANKELVSQKPEFWSDMYDDSKLAEEPCPPKAPRIGQAYQCDV